MLKPDKTTMTKKVCYTLIYKNFNQMIQLFIFSFIATIDYALYYLCSRDVYEEQW